MLLDLALAAARDAADVHRRHIGRVRLEDWSAKGVSDFVTHVDREAEARIVARIRTAFPDHAILAEEAASDAGHAAAGSAPDTPPHAAEFLWIVDPLDGTTNFLHAYPAYAASVAVAHRGELVAGAVVDSASGAEWTAVRGGGARRDAQPIHVSELGELRHSLIGTGFPFRDLDLLPRYLRQFDALTRRTAGIRRAGSAALDLCHVASGHFDGFWELALAPWDVAAGALIVREAGGLVTDLAGNPDILGGGPILAGNPVIHETLRRLLGELETTAPAQG
ncbi:MAG: inositol monophosphatase [Gemmatimonadetes bacterium]|nr:inositol monophosphatase [Gemmatimonadota bacterium]